MCPFRLFCIVIILAWVSVTALATDDVSMVTTDGVTLRGSYFPAASDSAPTLILLHMLGRDRTSWSAFATRAVARGMAVLTFDFRGQGQSTSSNSGPISIARFELPDYRATVNDVLTAVDWLKRRSPKSSLKIGIVGASFGANVALAYAARDPAIQVVALISPGSSYRGLPLDSAAKAYDGRPIFLTAAQDDDYSFLSAKNVVPLLTGPKQVEFPSEGGHGMYLLEQSPELADHILNFVESQLR
jgi:pimeloyl-ACP methyl ester carboxylesterase